METLIRTRAQRSGTLTLASLAAVAGATLISQPHWLRAITILGSVIAALAMVGQLDGDGGKHWTPRTRWAGLGAVVVFGAVAGLLVRILAHGVLLRFG
ncbi:MAG TPA: hypothetical protein VGM50_15580 [Gemmatimonadaceae bacterium]